MKRYIIVILMGIGWAFYCNAQPAPRWLKHRPKAENDTYYYRITVGEGASYNVAYSDAFAKAILESSWKIGVQVTTTDDLETIKNNIQENISIGTVESNIPINKVCEYIEQQSTTKFRVYCLWQIGFPQKAVHFEDFNNCE